MSARTVIGIDPGPVPGLVLLRFEPGVVLLQAGAMQSTHQLLPEILEGLLTTQLDDDALVQIERFVVGPRAARSSTPTAGEQTRQVVWAVQQVARRCDVELVARNAVAVKLWATDQRLTAAGLTQMTKGMRHARDAARHALFAAVDQAEAPDPLSRSGADFYERTT